MCNSIMFYGFIEFPSGNNVTIKAEDSVCCIHSQYNYSIRPIFISLRSDSQIFLQEQMIELCVQLTDHFS